MTQQELTLIKNEIIDQIQLDSRLIEELIPEIDLRDEDLFEINGGRYVSLRTLRDKFDVDIEKLSQYFLRKDRDDRTPYNLSIGGLTKAEGGVQFGESYAGGLTGHGGLIDGAGRGELRALRLWEWLEVPEIRYNKVEVISGTSWRAPGGGIVESVVPDLNADGSEGLTGLLKLKLEDGEVGEVKEDDLCMGIWHFEDGDNFTGEESDFNEDDSKGNFMKAGFMTVYFRITQILDKRNSLFRYALRNASNEGSGDVAWTRRAHPAEGMHFVAYTNLTDETRQTSCYETREYTRYLKGVRSWNYTASHIVMQIGDLENLKPHGLEMEGYSIFLNNVYMRGTIQKVEAPIFDIKAVAEKTEIGRGESVGVRLETTVDGHLLSSRGRVTVKSIKRDSGNPIGDAAWSAPEAGEDGSYMFSFSDLDGKESVMFTFSVHAEETVVSIGHESVYGEDMDVSLVLKGIEPVVTDRGPWEENARYYSGLTRRPETGRYETSDVWHLGRRWRCQMEHESDQTNAPRHGSLIWKPIGGDGQFILKFAEQYGLIPKERMDITLTGVARKGDEDVSDSELISYEWQRITEDNQGNPRTLLDAAWGNRVVDGVPRRLSGKRIRLTKEDCDWDSLGPGKVEFMLTATLRSPDGKDKIAEAGFWW